MSTFIIICLIAIAIEASRRYFIVNKYCGPDPLGMSVITSVVMIASMVSPFYLRNWVAICPGLLAIIVYLICGFANRESQLYKQSPTTEDKKRDAAYFGSILIPFLVIIPVTIVTINQDNKEFETKWQETTSLTISSQPIKTIVNGNEMVVLEFGLSADLSFGVNKYGFDILKLEEMDKIKYLKVGERERLEIITLRGKVCNKK